MRELVLTRDQVRSIDRRAIDEYEMPGVILMENAGRNAAELIDRRYGHPTKNKVAIFCGPGNNGGDGFVIARHLCNRGWQVRVVLTCQQDKLKGDALINYRIVEHTSIPIEQLASGSEVIQWSDLIVDALLGTGFTGQVREPLSDMIEQLNRCGKPIVAVDVPSGLDCDTGQPADATIRAEFTITFVAVKTGLAQLSARPYVGQVVVADIGVPSQLIRQVAGSAGS